jgi:hypothetical protein
MLAELRATERLNTNLARQQAIFRREFARGLAAVDRLQFEADNLRTTTQSGTRVDTNLVFVKTEKGRSEIETRDHSIHFKQRIALIMVNGKSTVDEMLPKIPGDGIALLEALHRDGYITPVAGSAPSVQAAPAAKPAATEEAASPSDNMASEKNEFNLENAKRQAVKVIESVLGPGGDAMSIAIERCKSRDEFERQAKRTLEVISQVGGSRKAAEFLAKTGLQ